MSETATVLLTVNAGSSSIRLATYAATAEGVAPCARHHRDGETGHAASVLQHFLSTQPTRHCALVAHRVVHGGSRTPGPHLIDAALERDIEAMVPLAPLHHPAALHWIRVCRDLLPNVPQVAVFDTAFFHAMPSVAQRYALPAELTQRHGLRRYGFHGLAHAAMLRDWRRTQGTAGGRVISLQLGSGCSITASRDGVAVDTSMGFSPLEGLVMATRPGDVDPGVLLHLLRSGAMDIKTLETTLNSGSGLLGVSGHSADMRTLLAADDDASQLAVALFVYRARKYLGAFLAVLGGADAVLFGGGIGEHAPQIRAAILDGMDWAGIRLDPEANLAAQDGPAPIHATTSAVAVQVIAVDEARELALAARETLSPADADRGPTTRNCP